MCYDKSIKQIQHSYDYAQQRLHWTMGLYDCFVISVFYNTIYGTFMMFFFNLFKMNEKSNNYYGNITTNSEKFSIIRRQFYYSSISAILASTVCYPIDTILKNSQASKLNSLNGLKQYKMSIIGAKDSKHMRVLYR
jgi:hypothetical protein